MVSYRLSCYLKKSNDEETSDSKIDDSTNSLLSFMLEDWRTGLPYLDILGNPQVLKDGLHGVGQINLKI